MSLWRLPFDWIWGVGMCGLELQFLKAVENVARYVRGGSRSGTFTGKIELNWKQLVGGVAHLCKEQVLRKLEHTAASASKWEIWYPKK